MTPSVTATAVAVGRAGSSVRTLAPVMSVSAGRDIAASLRLNLNLLDLGWMVAGWRCIGQGGGMADSVPARHAGRPRRAVLGRDRIAEAAMAIVDETGDFTLPELARRLG